MNGKVYSLKEFINHDLDVMYIYKPCVVGEEIGDETPLVMHQIPNYPGFYSIRKVRKIAINEKLDKLFSEFVQLDGFVSSRAILEESERVSIKSEMDNKVGSESKPNICKVVRGELTNKTEPTCQSIHIDVVKMEDLTTVLPRCGEAHPPKESMISGPAICVDLEGGFEFAGIEKTPDNRVANLLPLLKAINEAKLEAKSESGIDKKYAPRYRSFDMVNALPLKNWPTVTSAFFSRQRHSGWPNHDILQECLNSKCYFVCKGVPEHKDIEIMFRLSFSEAELVLSTHTPKKLRDCYRWAKLLLKLFLYEPKVLASYHLKTMLFWFLEDTQPENLEGETAPNLVRFIGYFLIACQNHNIPNYFYPEINMVKHIGVEEMQSFTSKLQDIHDNLPRYLREIKKSEFIKVLGNSQAVNHINQLMTNSNRKRFPMETKFDTESDYWEYAFLTLHSYRFSDEEIKMLISILEVFADDGKRSGRPHFVDILKRLCYGEFASEQQLWEYALGKEIDFPDCILEEIMRFSTIYGARHPEFLCDSLELLNM